MDGMMLRNLLAALASGIPEKPAKSRWYLRFNPRHELLVSAPWFTLWIARAAVDQRNLRLWSGIEFCLYHGESRRCWSLGHVVSWERVHLKHGRAVQ